MMRYSVYLSQFVKPDTKIKVYDLYVNGKCLFEEFFEEINEEGNLTKDLFGAINILEKAADLLMLPQTKFKVLKQSEVSCKVYEAKKNKVRIYCFEDEVGRIIVTGGKKNSQKHDIKSVLNLIKEYNGRKKIY